PKTLTRRVLALAAVIRHDNSDVPDGNESLRTRLHGREPSIDEECAVRQHLELLTATPSQREKDLRILEIVVIAITVADFRRDDLAGLEWRPIVDSDNADRVRRGDRQVCASDR